MATLIIRPNGAGGITYISDEYPDESAHWECVDEAVANDDEDYVYGTSMDVYALEDHGSETADITNVRVYARVHLSKNQDAAEIVISVQSSLYFSSPFTTFGSWQTFYKDWELNPKTNSAWTWSDIDGLEAGPYVIPKNGVVKCTQIYVEVTHEGGGEELTYEKSDAESLSDAKTPKLKMPILKTDGAALSDAGVPKLKIIYGQTDAESLADALIKSFKIKYSKEEISGLTDTFTSLFNLRYSKEDSADIADSLITSLHIISQIVDQIAESDTITAELIAKLLYEALDTIQFTDTAELIAKLLYEALDTIQFSDSYQTISSLIANLIDNILQNDELVAALKIKESAADIVALADLGIFEIIAKYSVDDGAVLSDTMESIAHMFFSGKDQVAISDLYLFPLTIRCLLDDDILMRDISFTEMAGLISLSLLDSLNIEDLRTVYQAVYKLIVEKGEVLSKIVRKKGGLDVKIEGDI